MFKIFVTCITITWLFLFNFKGTCFRLLFMFCFIDTMIFLIVQTANETTNYSKQSEILLDIALLFWVVEYVVPFFCLFWIFMKWYILIYFHSNSHILILNWNPNIHFNHSLSQDDIYVQLVKDLYLNPIKCLDLIKIFSNYCIFNYFH